MDFIKGDFRYVLMNKQLPVSFLTKSIENSLLAVDDIVIFSIHDHMVNDSKSFEAISTEFDS